MMVNVGKHGPVNVCCGAYPGHREECEHYDPVAAYARPELIGRRDGQPRRPRFGSGELVRDMEKRRSRHECQKPTGRFTRGDVWRCDCGRRFTWRTLGNPRNEGWLRRFWPWPR